MVINSLCILFKIHSVYQGFANKLQVRKRLWLRSEHGARSVTHLSARLRRTSDRTWPQTLLNLVRYPG